MIEEVDNGGDDQVRCGGGRKRRRGAKLIIQYDAKGRAKGKRKDKRKTRFEIAIQR